MQRPDVLVIGGGTAALCAAISARRTGAQVLLIEQAPSGLRGGNTRHSRNLRIMHEEPTAFSSDTYPEDDFWRDLWSATGGATDPGLARLLIRRSSDVTDWLADAGVHLQPTAGGVLPASRKTAFFLGGGKTMLNALYARARRLGVAIRYGCAARELLLQNARVERVKIQAGGGPQTLRPLTTVACCGGAQANRQWLRTQWGEAAEGFINRGTPFATGEVLASLLQQGVVAVGDPRGAYLVAVDARSPADDGGIVTRVRCMPAGIVVDVEGRRFHDEGVDTASTRYSAWGGLLADRPRQTGYLILDARGLRAAPPSLYPPLTARTLADLAAQLEMDPDRLQASVATYNAAVRPPAEGADPADWHTIGLYPPKSRHALTLIEPPFGAYPMRPGITFTYQGIGVDAQARVRMQAGGSAENLFAAGMIMAPNIIGRGYLSGLAITIGVVFGRIAGEEAARHACG